ncbi:MAG: hypothetical protein GY765_30190 [bacterium]|nr:hypothetical protein [bacterium]
MKKWWERTWFKSVLGVLGVTLVALLASMQMSGQVCLFEGRAIKYLRLFPIHLIYFSCWALLFLLIRKMCYYLLDRTHKWLPIVAFHLVTGVAVSVLHLLIVNALIKLGIWIGWIEGVSRDYKLMILAYRWISSNLYIYIAIAGFLHFFYFYKQHRQKDLEKSQLETQMAQIQLQSLRLQLQPHFLFNALNTISAYVKKSPDTAIKMTARLSNLLRLTLETGHHMEIPLEEELRIVENYLQIEKLRFSDRLEVKMDIDAETRRAMVPAMLLQPLVENAVRHGIAHIMDDAVIEIAIHENKGRLEVLVADNGPGMKEQSPNGIGLKNIRERLQKLYGDSARFDIESKENEGFRVNISFPFRVH